MFKRAFAALVSTVLIAVALTGPATADTPGDSDAPRPGQRQTGANPKIDPALLQAPVGVIPDTVQPVTSSDSVDIRITSADTDATVAALRAVGSDEIAVVGNSVFAKVRRDRLVPLAEDGSIEAIIPGPTIVPDTLAPDVAAIADDIVPDLVSQGVGTMGVNEWRAAGATGAGTKIAIFDAGYANYQSLMNANELPRPMAGAGGAGVLHTGNFCSNVNATNHGTAVAEIIHDVAPQAQILTYCVDSFQDLVDAMNDAVARGAKVISMSMSWYDLGTFGKGNSVYNDMAAWAANYGVMWVNSAGNNAQRHYRAALNTSGGAWHRFSGTDTDMAFTLAAGQTLSFYLRWDEYPADPNASLVGYTAPTDLDAHLYKASDLNSPVASSTRDQTAGQVLPYESLSFTAPEAGTYYFTIHRYSNNTATPTVDLYVLGYDPVLEYTTSNYSIVEPGVSPNVLTVGAVKHDTNIIREYSSEGPNAAGLPKPDIYGPDGTSSLIYTTANGFTGTSASTPHVAAAAALFMQSGYAQGLTVAQTRTLLKSSQFTVPVSGKAANHATVSGNRTLKLKGASQFNDVLMSHPFVAGIGWMNATGVSTGYNDGSFRPNDPVSRQAMAAFMYRFADADPYTAPAVSPFKDMTPASPFYKEAAWMAEAEISTGYDDGTYRPSATVSRQAMAAFMYRLAGEPAVTLPSVSPFSDVAVGSQFYKPVIWMRESGVTTGYDDGTFRPSAAVSRQAMSAFMLRLAQYLTPGLTYPS